MRLFVLSLFLLFLLPNLGIGQQTHDQRTLSTKIADILAKFPAENQQQSNSNMEQLISTGPEGLQEVMDMWSAPGEGNNTSLEYAISALSSYLMQPGKERERKIAVEVYCNALMNPKHPAIRRFIISQLRFIGNDDALLCLGSSLNDEKTAGEAARTIAQINSPAAGGILLRALASAPYKARLSIVSALGYMHFKEAAPAIQSAYKSDGSGMKKVAAKALAQIGDKASFSSLQSAAKQAGYDFDSTDAVSAYLLYLRQLFKNGPQSDAIRLTGLLKSEIPTNKIQTRIAVLELLTTMYGRSALPMLYDAMQDDNIEYREAALQFSTAFCNSTVNKQWLKTATSVSLPAKQQIIRYLGHSGDKSLLSSLIPYTSYPNTKIRMAAIKAVAQIGEKSAIPALMNRLKKGDSNDISAVKDALLHLRTDDIGPLISKDLNEMSPAAQVALIEVLAARRADSVSGKVFALLKNADASLQHAVINALPALAKAADIPRLFAWLQTTDEEDLPDIQDALIIAFSEIPDTLKRTQWVVEEIAAVSGNKKYLFLPVLAAIGGKDALQKINEMYKNGQMSERKIIINALAKNTDRMSADLLGKIALAAAGTENGARALEGYIKIIGRASFLPDEKIWMLQGAMKLATNDEQRKEIVHEAGRNKTFMSLAFAGKYMDEPALCQEAADAVISIALYEPEIKGKMVRDLLTKAGEVIGGQDAVYKKQAVRKYLDDMSVETGSPVFSLSEQEAKEHFKVLFDGTNLDAWVDSTTKDYYIENNELVAKPNASGDNIYTREEYGNFIFRFEFLLTPAANNGLGIRAPLEGDAAYLGMEIQILDNDADVYKNLKPYQYHGSVYGVIPAKRGFLKPTGEWNYEEVIVNGSRIKVVLNNEVILDGDIQYARDHGAADHQDHPGLRRDKGHIGFLGHGSLVKFRNIRVKTL